MDIAVFGQAAGPAVNWAIIGVLILIAVPIFGIVVIFSIARAVRSRHDAPDGQTLPWLLGTAAKTAACVFGTLALLALLMVGTTVNQTPTGRRVAETRAVDEVTVSRTATPIISGVPENFDAVGSDETIWLPVTRSALEEAVGAEDVEALSANIPSDLLLAYEFMPPSSNGPVTGHPVVRRVLSPAALRQLLTPDNVRSLVTAVASYLPESAGTDAVAEMPAESAAPHEPAYWIRNPGIGQVVVNSGFVESTTSAEDALRPAIVEALEERVTQLSVKKYGTGDFWKNLVDVSVTDDVVRQCIVTTDAQHELIETVAGPKMMRQTYALVEFPEAVEEEVLTHVRTSLVKNRTIAVCLAFGSVWLIVFALSFVVRTTRSDSRLRRLAAVPMMILLIVPCAAVTIGMTAAMANGDTFEFEWAGNRVKCVVDNSSDRPHTRSISVKTVR